MPKVGDRIVVQGLKVGGARREGTLTQLVGSLIKVRWTDGSETLFAPGAGTVEFLPGSAKAAAKAGTKVVGKTAAKPAKSSKKKSGKR